MNLSNAIAGYAARTGIPDEDVLRMAVEEGFLRRAARVGGPFALKGSYVTRQHLKEGWRRIPGDLDWVGLEQLDANDLSEWVTAVTETPLDDGVRFRSFAANAFWRQIDYAMDDDFPTVNTDLEAWVGDRSVEIDGMDVSFGLRLQPPPRPLEYTPLFGDPFVLPAACGPELQIAWKLHQCMVRPRFKDVLDVGLLLRDNPLIEAAAVWPTVEDECLQDSTPLERFNDLLDGTFFRFPGRARGAAERHLFAEHVYALWRTDSGEIPLGLSEDALATLYVGAEIPDTLDGFLGDFATQLRASGFSRVAVAQPAAVEKTSPAAVQTSRPWWKLW